MISLGFCTHFSDTDEWAFEYALKLARDNNWQLNICHWVNSPFRIRRDVIQDDLFHPGRQVIATPQNVAKLELQLREYYDERLGDYTNVAFKLCEGHSQVELARCFRKHLLDLVVMGYQAGSDDEPGGSIGLDNYAGKLTYPVILVGHRGMNSYLINSKAREWFDQLEIADATWEALEAERV